MIATRLNTFRFAFGRHRLGELLSRNHLTLTPEQRQARESLFDRAGTLEEYFAQPRARSLTDELADSRQEIERLRQEIAVAKYQDGEESQLGRILVETLGRIAQVTERLFPGPTSVEYAVDPEDPSHQWLVFDVVAQGEYADYRNRKTEWYDEVAKIVPGTLCEFRLCVAPLR